MKALRNFLALGLCAAALGATQARADALEDDYLKSRNVYIARFNPGKEIDFAKIEAPLKRALADLQGKMRKIVGKPGVAGATGEGKYAIDTLMKDDVGFGSLDALIFNVGADKTQAYVTTSGLFGAWLKEHRDWWEKDMPNVPQDIAGALSAEAFYTQAISADAAVTKFADIPVKAPEGVTARAMLDRRQQDDGPGAPDELIVGTERGGRIYILVARAIPKPPVIPACEQVWKDAEKKSDEAYEKGHSGAMKDEEATNLGETLRSDGDKAFRACYAEKIKATPVYAKLVERAQGLVERVGK